MFDDIIEKLKIPLDKTESLHGKKDRQAWTSLYTSLLEAGVTDEFRTIPFDNELGKGEFVLFFAPNVVKVEPATPENKTAQVVGSISATIVREDGQFITLNKNAFMGYLDRKGIKVTQGFESITKDAFQELTEEQVSAALTHERRPASEMISSFISGKEAGSPFLIQDMKVGFDSNSLTEAFFTTPENAMKPDFHSTMSIMFDNPQAEAHELKAKEKDFAFPLQDLLEVTYRNPLPMAFAGIKDDLLDAYSYKKEADTQLMAQTYDYINLAAHSRFLEAGIEPPKGDMTSLYPPALYNFILDAKTPEALRYRKEFVDTTYTKMYGSLDDAVRQLHEITESSTLSHVWVAILQKAKLSKDKPPVFQFAGPDEDIIAEIDRGSYPWKSVSEKFGFKSISKKQFDTGLQILNNEMLYDSATHLDETLALAKFPPHWLTKESIQSMQGSETFRKMLPMLVNTGKQIDDAQFRKDKPALARINGRHQWMKHNDPSEFYAVIEAFDEKHKFSAQVDDHAAILGSLIETVRVRAVADHPAVTDPNEVLFINDDSDVANDIVSVNIFELRDQISSNSPMSEDLQDTFDEEFFFTSMDNQLPEYLTGSGGDVKGFAEANNTLHKEYGNFIQTANAFSSHNVAWAGLTDKPVVFEGLEFMPIDNRIDLLYEGATQKHCVFSYLGRCMSGDTSIVSVRDPASQGTIATIELKASHNDKVRMVQCYGENNNEVDAYWTDIIERYVDAVNSSAIPTNDFTKLNSSSDIYRDILDNPLEMGYITAPIPNHTDAAYFAYFFIERHLPNEEDMDWALSGNEFTTDYMSQSTFIQNAKKLKALSAELNASPFQLLEFKKAMDNGSNSPLDVDMLSTAFSKQREIAQLGVSTLESLPAHMNDEHRAKAIALALQEEYSFAVDNPEKLKEAVSQGTTALSEFITMSNVNPLQGPENPSPSTDSPDEAQRMRIA